MKRMFAALLALMLLPACALAQINLTEVSDAASGSTLAV